MAINYLILLSRQGKVRLAKWFTTLSPKEKAKIVKDVSQLVLSRRTRMCNFIEYKDSKIVYRRYASLFFIAGCSPEDNELITLEIVHRYVEQMDKYYGNVCELDIIFNFQKAYFILDELLLAGEMQESSKKNVLRSISQEDSLEDMEFMPVRDLDIVTSTLNFSTPDLHVLGGCDLYTTKAAGGDKKLYKSIEHGLQEQHKANVQFSSSLSPPQAHVLASSLNLSRSSPFGNLGFISSRRTYAYLIATLNASHPDYDFSASLRPSDFKREKSLRHVMNTIDTTLYNLRPQALNSFLESASLSPGSPFPPATQPNWGPSMWRLIDMQMSLKECSIYRYAPDDVDPFEDDEDGSLWSLHYFFFNKTRKRVLYLYLRGLSALSHSGKDGIHTPVKSKRFVDDETEGWLTPDLGAHKRAKYWLGDRQSFHVSSLDDTDMSAADQSDKLATSDDRSDEDQFGPPARPVVDENGNYLLSDEDARSIRSASKATTVRRFSDDFMGPMDFSAAEEKTTEEKASTQADDAVDPDEEAFNAVVQSASQGDQPAAPDTETDSHVEGPSQRIEQLEREIQALAQEAAEHEARWRKTEQALEELDEIESLRKEIASKDSAIADLQLEVSRLRPQESWADGHGSQVSTLLARVSTLEAENAKLRDKNKRSTAGAGAADDDALDELEDEERNKLTSRIRELEGQVFDLQRVQWREKRTSVPRDIDSTAIPRNSFDPGEAFDEVDLSAGTGPASLSGRPHQRQQQQKHSNLTQYISSGINAFLPSTATSPPPQSPWSRPRNDSLLQDFDEAPFDEAAFAHAQREEEAKKMLLHVREVKTGLRNWKSWRLDLVDARPLAGSWAVLIFGSDSSLVTYDVEEPEQLKKSYQWTDPTDQDGLDEIRDGKIFPRSPADGRLLQNEPIRPASAADIDDAIAAAAAAQKPWSQTTFGQRKRVLRSLLKYVIAHQDSIATASSLDSGKTLVDASFGEILVTAEKLQWTLKHGEAALAPSTRPTNLLMCYKSNTVYYEPLGVVAACVSWNYPFHNLISPVISTIFAGNAIVVKPSEQTAWSSLYFTRIIKGALHACGHSPDLVQTVICLPGIADHLTSHPTVKHITFIGSRPVAHKVAASAANSLTSLTVELGGKDPAVVLDDPATVADISSIASILLRGVFQASGQNCIGIERIIALPGIHDKLLDLVLPTIKSLTIGNILRDGHVDMGAMVSSRTFDQLEALISAAVQAGAVLHCGGSRYHHPKHPHGTYFSPTLLSNVTAAMEIAHTELFAPVFLLMRADSVDHAIGLANSTRTEFALGASVFGHDQAAVNQCVHAIKAGNVAVNDFGAFYACSMPFGGRDGSGYGRFGGHEGLRALSNLKSVSRDAWYARALGIRTTIPPPLRYPVHPSSAWHVCARVVQLGYSLGLTERVQQNSQARQTL
ncbi:hypothetical protein DV735_g4427, partial [Chaetothyriales sp. CBS 134920]